MITGLYNLAEVALKGGETTVQYWSAGFSYMPIKTPEPVELFLGKANGQIALIIAENIDSKVSCTTKVWENVASVVDADEHKGWTAGYRSE